MPTLVGTDSTEHALVLHFLQVVLNSTFGYSEFNRQILTGNLGSFLNLG